jgi:hypothetical protein
MRFNTVGSAGGCAAATVSRGECAPSAGAGAGAEDAAGAACAACWLRAASSFTLFGRFSVNIEVSSAISPAITTTTTATSSRGADTVKDFEMDTHRADFQFVAGCQAAVPDDVAVDANDRRTIEIANVVAIRLTFDGRVTVAYARFGNLDVAIRVAADDQRRPFDNQRPLPCGIIPKH